MTGGRRPIEDEFTHLKVSRQRKSELRRIKANRALLAKWQAVEIVIWRRQVHSLEGVRTQSERVTVLSVAFPWARVVDADGVTRTVPIDELSGV